MLCKETSQKGLYIFSQKMSVGGCGVVVVGGCGVVVVGGCGEDFEHNLIRKYENLR